MRINPSTNKSVKEQKLNQAIENTTRVAAIILAFISVFFFLFKLLFF